ncbi:MAG TPA: DEAD/DEAH box helicase [Polyangiaceae bacterium]|nr:DEAD/DEAH box helicase [Polyangiaceae bacterium]
MNFSDLNLIQPLLRAVATEGYDVPTPIQQQAIPHVLEGRDLLGCAQTGTGKTAAFALPILQRLATSSPAPTAQNGRVAPIRVLVLTPTRELASQIGDSFSVYGRNLRIRNTVIFGGVGQRAQEKALAAGPEVLVATPGRLLDLASQGKVSLRNIEIFVLDEADRMLDMGFIHDVRRVISLLPARRQTLFFSATMPPDILDLSARILNDPARVAVTPIASTAEKVQQSVFFVGRADKRALLEHVLGDPAIERVLVFTRTKHGANRVADQLCRARISAEAIHGNKSQNARERALDSFKRGESRVLVATDIAARGIDVEGISHVINFDLPDVPESYVHRIGRTARAGASGMAFSFCDSEERPLLAAIERLIRTRLPVVEDHPLRDARPASQAVEVGRQYSRQGRQDRGRPPSQTARRPQAPSGENRAANGRNGPDVGRSSESPAGRSSGDERGAAAPSPRSAGGTARRFSSRPRRRYTSA